MIEQLIDSKIQPLLDRITSLEEEIESGARRGRNAISLGRVVKVVGDRVVIAIGKAKTPAIKWFALAAGDVIECRYPSVNEMALVLNYGSGDRTTSSIALVGIPSDEFPLPSKDQNLVIRKVGPLGWEEWDKEKGTLTFRAPEKVRFETKLLECTGDVKDKVRTMSADRDIYNDHDHPETQVTTQKPNQRQ